uniref:Putative HNH homing endonuclease n=1 Tax=viral metagenome TaxID=1070528 RepID=A0A6M3JSH3_9ZZZZ
MIDSESAIYLAGFVDGEGCILINKRRVNDHHNSQYILVLAIGTTSFEIIPFLKSLGFYTCKGKAKNRPEHWKDLWLARISDKKAKDLLIAMLPYLKIKKEHAKLAIEFQDRKSNYKAGTKGNSEEELQYRELIRTRIQELNRRGK